MMMSEFIERTGFEPTGAEYREIEEAYYDFDGDKDQFCKKWVKDGGIQRLARRRQERIEELEQMYDSKIDEVVERERYYVDQIDRIVKGKEALKKANEGLQKDLDESIKETESWRIRYREIEVKMVKIQEVFAMLNGKEAMA